MLLLVSGSPDAGSANSRFLRSVGRLARVPFASATYLAELPVFQPARDSAPWPAPVLRWRQDVAAADALLFSTPSYLHNLPGVLKNALDWLASSGELDQKPVLVFTFTPAPPRGERARQSLLWSLSALNARVLGEAAFYQSEVSFTENGDIAAGDEREMLAEALQLLP